METIGVSLGFVLEGRTTTFWKCISNSESIVYRLFGMVFITDNLEKASIIPLPPSADFLCSCVFHMEAPGKRYCRGVLDPSFLKRYPLHTDMSEQILLILQFRERPRTGSIWVDPKSREALIILEVGVFLTSHSVDIASKAHWRDLRGLCISLFFFNDSKFCYVTLVDQYLLKRKKSVTPNLYYFYFPYSLTQLSSGNPRARTLVPWNTMYLGDQQLLLKSLRLKILYLERTVVALQRSSHIQRKHPMSWTSRGVSSARYKCSLLISVPLWKRCDLYFWLNKETVN